MPLFLAKYSPKSGALLHFPSPNQIFSIVLCSYKVMGESPSMMSHEFVVDFPVGDVQLSSIHCAADIPNPALGK